MEQFARVLRKDGQALRYLIVDDSVFARKNLSRMIESFGGQVAGEAGDGRTNKTLIEIVSQALAIKPYQLTITKGHYHAQKTVQIQGMHPDELQSKLAAI